jgi:hypothetical protein
MKNQIQSTRRPLGHVRSAERDFPGSFFRRAGLFALAMARASGATSGTTRTHKPNLRKTPAMLSEHHDISHEFPEYRRMIDTLRATDASFDSLVARHDYIDDEIRQLEEKQSPISDSEIEKMKFERAALKDQIYHCLRTAAAKA